MEVRYSWEDWCSSWRRLIGSLSAAAARFPNDLWEQLAEGGILVVPVGDPYSCVMTRAEKSDGKRHVTRHGSYAFVPLV